MSETSNKTCFMICPIGEAGSDSRNRSDYVLEYIIRPVLESDEFKHTVERSDKYSRPGLITDDLIVSLLDADVVIADLTELNPNVFYELGIRHMAEKKIIHMAERETALPFDIKDYRAIIYKLDNPMDIEAAKEELTRQMKATEEKNYKVSNPVTKAAGYRHLTTSPDTTDQLLARMIERVDEQDASINRVERYARRSSNINVHQPELRLHDIDSRDLDIISDKHRGRLRNIEHMLTSSNWDKNFGSTEKEISDYLGYEPNLTY